MRSLLQLNCHSLISPPPFLKSSVVASLINDNENSHSNLVFNGPTNQKSLQNNVSSPSPYNILSIPSNQLWWFPPPSNYIFLMSLSQEEVQLPLIVIFPSFLSYLCLRNLYQSFSFSTLILHTHFPKRVILKSLMFLMPNPPCSLSILTLSHSTQFTLLEFSFPPQRNCLKRDSSLKIIPDGALKNDM